MKTKLSIKILFWITHVATLVYFAFFVVFVAVSIGYLAGIRFEQIDFEVPLPAEAQLNETGTWNNTTTVKLSNMSGDLYFQDAPSRVKVAFFAFLFLAILVMGIALFSFRAFCKNIYESRIFDIKNSKMLKYVAMSFLAFWIFDMVYYQLAHHLITSKINFQHIEFTANVSIFTNELFMALFLWVLALIFKRGTELEEDKKLTI